MGGLSNELAIHILAALQEENTETAQTVPHEDMSVKEDHTESGNRVLMVLTSQTMQLSPTQKAAGFTNHSSSLRQFGSLMTMGKTSMSSSSRMGESQLCEQDHNSPSFTAKV